MADKTYEVQTPIQHASKRLDVGDLVEFNDKTAAPLVECGALVEQKTADKPKK